MLLYPETDMHDIREQINDVKPDLWLSIQFKR